MSKTHYPNYAQEMRLSEFNARIALVSNSCQGKSSNPYILPAVGALSIEIDMSLLAAYRRLDGGAIKKTRVKEEMQGNWRKAFYPDPAA